MQGLNTLRAAFQNNLDAQTQEKAWKPNERAIWILEHLDMIRCLHDPIETPIT